MTTSTMQNLLISKLRCYKSHETRAENYVELLVPKEHFTETGQIEKAWEIVHINQFVWGSNRKRLFWLLLG